jgi:4-nitrophenyl phosphatase
MFFVVNGGGRDGRSTIVAIDLTKFDAVLLDLDGTVYHEHHPLPGAIELIRKLQSDRRTFACLSNSASSPQRVCRRLEEMGVRLETNQVYTAALAVCDYVMERFAKAHPRADPPSKLPVQHAIPRVFNLCTESVYEMLEGRVHWVETADEPCDAVICGAPSNVHATPDRQRIAMELLRRGAVLAGLCNDRVYPSPRGLELGSGSQCAMLAYAANVTPVFCGKPERIFFVELCTRLKVLPEKCVLIGDNLESDVAGAKGVGMTSVLTMSGVTNRKELEALSTTERPEHVVEDLTELI